ncbi:DNA-binding domain-containing protein [soil metagenome]
MNTELSRFQDGFVQALWAAPDAVLPPLRALAEQPGFAVYRNTVIKGCIDALQANYPAIARLVGEEWFRAAAALHVSAQPPHDARLLLYGLGFADFLRGFEPAAELPYLPGVARLDRFWTEAHMAADAATLAPTALAGLPPEELGRLVLQPHPAARWAWFDDAPIYTLWRRNRDGGAGAPNSNNSDDAELVWRGEGALLTRPVGCVNWTALDAAGCAFLDACAAGRPLADAADAALARQAGCDLERLMAALLDAGAFCSAQPFAEQPLTLEPT